VLPSATAGAWSSLAFACSTVTRAAFTRATFPLAVSALAVLAAFLRPFVRVNDAVGVLVELGEQLSAVRPLFLGQNAIAVLVIPDVWRDALVLDFALFTGTPFTFATGGGIFSGRSNGRQAEGQRCDDYDSLHVVFLSVVRRFVRRFSEGIRLP